MVNPKMRTDVSIFSVGTGASVISENAFQERKII